MLIVHDRSNVQAVQSKVVQRFLERRFAQLDESIGDEMRSCVEGQFIVVQPGDTAREIEEAAGFPLLKGLFDDAAFGTDDYSPGFEWATDHGDLYEILFVHSDGGDFTAIVIPRQEKGIDGQLLALCATYAKPEPAIT